MLSDLFTKTELPLVEVTKQNLLYSMHSNLLLKFVWLFLQLTNGWCFPSMVMALTSYIEQFAGRLAQAARHVEKQKASITDDWTVFTTCLNLIQAAGEEYNTHAVHLVSSSSFRIQTCTHPADRDKEY